MWVVKDPETGLYSNRKNCYFNDMVEDINQARTFTTKSGAQNHNRYHYKKAYQVVKVQISEVPDDV